MTKLLQKAFDTASTLPDSAQDEVASIILEELASEERWAAAFAKSQAKLTQLADEALKEFKRGETQALDF
jgi:hypothetical protein